MAFWNRIKSSSHNSHQQLADEPQTKRISTPAGRRLSIILENGSSDSQTTQARETHRTSVRKSGLSPALADAPRESSEEQSGNSSGYSYSVWSDGEKRFAKIRNHKQITKRGGWKKLGLLILLVLLLVVGLGVGLAMGLKKKSSGSSSSTSSQSDSTSNNSNPSSPTSPSSPSSPSSSPEPSLPANFPFGTFSLVTFLDTVQTNCTANPATWTCYPYTDYYTSPSSSLATFNWVIGGKSPSALTISSTENPFSISFQNAPLDLLDAGKPTERYRFQLQLPKTVSPRTSLTDDGSAVECDYKGTNLQASLYTKRRKEFPDATTGDGDPAYTTWPFAVLIEQSTAGGENVPSCHKTAQGKEDEKIGGLPAQSGDTLCSCLYKNWHTPS